MWDNFKGKKSHTKQCSFSNFFSLGKNVEEKNNRLLTSCKNFLFQANKEFYPIVQTW